MDKLQASIKQAMLAKDAHKLATLRMLKSAADLAQKEKGADLGEADFVNIVRKQIKMRSDAADGFTKAGDSDKAAKEQAETVFLQEFMPEQMDEAELTNLVDEVIAKEGIALERQNMGRLIGLVAAAAGDKASKSDIAKLINTKIG